MLLLSSLLWIKLGKVVANVERKIERSLRGVCGVPSGERRGIGPSVDSCSLVIDESCIICTTCNGGKLLACTMQSQKRRND